MKINDLIYKAEESGFTHVNDGATTWDLDNFLDAMTDDESDYTMHFDGRVYRYRSDGLEESVHCFFFEKNVEVMLSTDPIVEKYLKMALENDVPFTYDDISFINIKRLYDFEAKNVKAKSIIFEEVVKEVIRCAYVETDYELGRHETKSGNPEALSFDYSFDYDEEDEISNRKIVF